MMDKLNAMSAFVEVVEQQSFTKAAQILDLPRSTLTDAIKQLEIQLNTRLLFRTTRKVRSIMKDVNIFWLISVNRITIF